MKHNHPSTEKIENTLPAIKIACLSIFFLLATIAGFSNGLAQPGIVSAATKHAPFELISFKAKQQTNTKVVLSWATSAETGTSHFVMQRSADGKSFDDAGLLFTDEGDRNTTKEYKYPDNINSVKDEQVWYRLKMVTLDGHYTYSDAVMVRIEAAKTMMAYNNTNK